MIVYFVIKNPAGQPMGCVRWENGRAESSCPCLLVKENGETLAIGQGETPVPGQLVGAITLKDGALYGWGLMPGVRLSREELWYLVRQHAKATSPAEAGPPAQEAQPMAQEKPVAPEPEPVAQEPEPVAQEAQPVSVSEPETDSEPDSAQAAADFGLLVGHAGAVYDGLLRPPLERPAPSPRDSWLWEADRLARRRRR